MYTLRLAGLFLAASAAVAVAQVPLTQEPHHKVTFENAQFRILNVSLPVGETTADHRHEFDVATISTTSGTETRLQTAGQPWEARKPRPLGDATVAEYTGKPQAHKIENNGKSPYQLFAVENLRKNGWSTTPAAKGLATKMTNETRAFRLYDVHLVREVSQTSHTHAVPTLVVLLSGSVISDGPDAKAKENAPAPVGLKQLTQLGQWILVPGGDTHHVVRLGPNDARVVEIEIR
jgi:quercetin dioxygenase-like cupin family protein